MQQAIAELGGANAAFGNFSAHLGNARIDTGNGVLTLFLYQTAGSATQLPLEMTWLRAIVVLALTLVMCTVSGVIAARKVRTLDPADIF